MLRSFVFSCMYLPPAQLSCSAHHLIACHAIAHLQSLHSPLTKSKFPVNLEIFFRSLHSKLVQVVRTVIYLFTYVPRIMIHFSRFGLFIQAWIVWNAGEKELWLTLERLNIIWISFSWKFFCKFCWNFYVPFLLELLSSIWRKGAPVHLINANRISEILPMMLSVCVWCAKAECRFRSTDVNKSFR